MHDKKIKTRFAEKLGEGTLSYSTFNTLAVIENMEVEFTLVLERKKMENVESLKISPDRPVQNMVWNCGSFFTHLIPVPMQKDSIFFCA